MFCGEKVAKIKKNVDNFLLTKFNYGSVKEPYDKNLKVKRTSKLCRILISF